MLRRILKRLGWSVLILLVILNIFAIFHAWKFTHFSDTTAPKTDPRKLDFAGKLKTIVFGVDNPRPVNLEKPSAPYTTVMLQSHEKLEAWMINVADAKGTVILFHGYSGSKSGVLDKAEEFQLLGFNTMLVDFQGSGGSGGNATTIGFEEGADVKAAFDYLEKQGEQRIYLFGTSMGAAAILKAMHDYPLQPIGLILECPFGSLYDATAARMRAVGLPGFPLANFLVFWGGIENGFWGFAHQPTEYAKSVKVPVLFFYGERDERVTRKETDDVYRNLQGPKQLITFPQAGHVNYLTAYRKVWRGSVVRFLQRY